MRQVKEELIKRVRGVYRLKILDRSSLSHADELERLASETDRFTLPTGEQVATALSLSGWTTDYNTIPGMYSLCQLLERVPYVPPTYKEKINFIRNEL